MSQVIEMNIKELQYETLRKYTYLLPTQFEIARKADTSQSSVRNVLQGVQQNQAILTVLKGLFEISFPEGLPMDLEYMFLKTLSND